MFISVELSCFTSTKSSLCMPF